MTNKSFKTHEAKLDRIENRKRQIHIIVRAGKIKRKFFRN